MSMFGDGSAKEQIYQELKWIYNEYYTDHESPEAELNFVLDVLYVLHSWFGDW